MLKEFKINTMILCGAANVIAGYVAFMLFGFITDLMAAPVPNFELVVALAALFGGLVASTLTADFALATTLVQGKPDPVVPAGLAERMLEIVREKGVGPAGPMGPRGPQGPPGMEIIREKDEGPVGPMSPRGPQSPPGNDAPSGTE